MMIKKGAWVRIHEIILKPEERSGNLPQDTKQVPLEMWVKGFLEEPAAVGDLVKVRTITGRQVAGRLIEVNPFYDHDFGKFVPELLEIGIQLRGMLWEGDQNE
ncbi:2-amino-4-oxopentanoate thiolase subunit OrtA [Alkaliphilus crotonatoxidans]